MTRKSSARHILLPILGIVIAAVIFILPNKVGSTSYDDVASIIVSTHDGNSVELTDVKDMAAFVTWLKDFVPEDDIKFIAHSSALIPDDAEISAVVQSVPGDAGVMYMYLYADGESISYNGMNYKATSQDMDNFHAFSELKNAE